MKPETTDRRSQRTRKSLSEALIALMLEKRYDKITVQDIIERANVGRSTFYSHCRDKEDLLVGNFEHVLDAFSQHFDQGHAMSVVALFRHAQEYHPVYETLVWGRGIELLYKQGQAFLCRRIEADLASLLPPGEQPAVPLSILSTYVAGTLVTVLRWWLDHKMPYPPERMDEIFHQLIMPTLEAALPPVKR